MQAFRHWKLVWCCSMCLFKCFHSQLPHVASQQIGCGVLGRKGAHRSAQFWAPSPAQTMCIVALSRWVSHTYSTCHLSQQPHASASNRVPSVLCTKLTQMDSFAVQMPKQRKMVDRRASKGRKIRFNVMDKLVNFMEPMQMYDDDADGRISSLYGNLFGHAAQ